MKDRKKQSAFQRRKLLRLTKPPLAETLIFCFLRSRKKATSVAKESSNLLAVGECKTSMLTNHPSQAKKMMTKKTRHNKLTILKEVSHKLRVILALRITIACFRTSSKLQTLPPCTQSFRSLSHMTPPEP